MGSGTQISLQAPRWEQWPAQARFALTRLEERGFEAAIVGGCVRDMLLGGRPSDTDITTSALPEQVIAAFADERVVPTGLRHGTVTLIKDRVPIEITTFRCDGDYSDMRRPDSVTFTRSLREDVVRRDFTMNAIAWERGSGLIDHVGGMEDLRAMRIRAVGDPRRRFSEDALRIIRALRFHAQLSGAFPGFSIEEETGAAIRALYGNLRRVAPERVWKELGRLVTTNGGPVLRAYPEVFRMLLPCAAELSEAQWEAACVRLESVSEGVARAEGYACWAALLGGAGAGPAMETLRGLRADKRTIEETGACVEIARLARPDMGTLRRLVGEQYPLAARIGAENARAGALGIVRSGVRVAFQGEERREAMRILDEIEREGLACGVIDLRVSGGDLAALGLRGAAVGEGLRTLLEAVLAGEVSNDRVALLARADTLGEGGASAPPSPRQG